MKDIGKKIVIFLFIFLAFAAILSLFNPSLDAPEEIDISGMIEKINNEEIKEIVVSGDKLEITLMDDTEVVTQKETGESFSELVKNYGVTPEKLETIKLTIKDESGLAFWTSS